MVKFNPTSLKELNEKKRKKAAKERSIIEAVAALENALCEMDEANAERMAAIEDALCEIDGGAV